MKSIVFTGGGSAGHVVPNLALIEELKNLKGVTTYYFGSNGLEKSLIEPLEIPYFQIDCPKLIRGKSLRAFAENLRIPFRLSSAVRQAKRRLKTLKPSVVFSKGGYVALPVVIAAKRLKIPCFTHESDLSMGLANKLLAKKCNAVYTSFPETAEGLKNGVFSGAPMRKELFEYDKLASKIKFSLPLNKKVLLVLGGGSGSKTINEALRNNLEKLSDYSVLHICGKGNLVKSTRENYRQFEYLSNVGEAYAAADVVLSRAGAGAIFEILALKKPAVLVPLEGQTRGDQLENAAYFEKKRLCKVLRQRDLQLLAQTIDKTAKDVTLAKNLANTRFRPGNEKILADLKVFL
jgi:UDP-N-acetylglucosamine--N-acetylmuramyl-(pentapeptide) pyrophosphoryl-undecaprenol N-acetylglucosamine transferase